jgi:type II secretory pathway predicted ATPase ExeA
VAAIPAGITHFPKLTTDLMMPSTTTSSGMNLQQLLARGERPFPANPQVARYFPAVAIEDSRQRLARAIERGDGPGLVIGAAGTGKSLLLQVLAAQYHERFDVVLLGCARLCTRRALLQAILFELGLPYGSRDEGQLRLSLLDQLLSINHSPAGLLLLVDEAQSLSIQLLDELRVLTNAVRGGIPRVRLVLAGSSALEESFANPELESLSQRLAARAYLAPFSRPETIQFVRAQVAASDGGPDDIFNADALDAVFDATDGVPRLVNQLCDQALLIAETRNLSRVDREVVQAAWSDLQQLPMPMAVTPGAGAKQTASTVVEFAGMHVAEPIASMVADHSEQDIEPTELDAEDEPAERGPAMPAQVACPRPPKRSCPVGADPFAEEFDEEEIVLDNFAAWDDMFSSRTPRVENARDLGFADRVQYALEAVQPSQPASDQEIGFDPNPDDLENFDVDAIEEVTECDSNWPPIRLAVVEDAAPLKPVPLIAPPGGPVITGAASFDPVMPEAEPPAGFCYESALRAARRGQSEMANPEPSFDEDPILVIEDDSIEVQPCPPVRRESYKHLFSRLRSG